MLEIGDLNFKCSSELHCNGSKVAFVVTLKCRVSLKCHHYYQHYIRSTAGHWPSLKMRGLGPYLLRGACADW